MNMVPLALARVRSGRFQRPMAVLPTQGSANPALTIMSLAARCADLLIDSRRTGRATA
jgi:choline dehydrogenase-like flavoprotein